MWPEWLKLVAFCLLIVSNSEFRVNLCLMNLIWKITAQSNLNPTVSNVLLMTVIISLKLLWISEHTANCTRAVLLVATPTIEVFAETAQALVRGRWITCLDSSLRACLPSSPWESQLTVAGRSEKMLADSWWNGSGLYCWGRLSYCHARICLEPWSFFLQVA